jgi:hypothetical protein
MRDAIKWFLAKTLLYVALTVAGLLGSAVVYNLARGHSGAAHFAGSLGSPRSWLPGLAAIALVAACFIALALGPLAVFRERLPGSIMKLILIPYLMIPVAFVDLVGSPIPFTLVVLGMQVCYLVIVRFNSIRA